MARTQIETHRLDAGKVESRSIRQEVAQPNTNGLELVAPTRARTESRALVGFSDAASICIDNYRARHTQGVAKADFKGHVLKGSSSKWVPRSLTCAEGKVGVIGKIRLRWIHGPLDETRHTIE
jgi:hypothetical protein